MLFKLFLLFVIVPLVELSLLLILADQTSVWFSVGLVIATGFLGATLARGQGIAALQRLRQAMHQNQVPTTPLLDAALIFFAGALLLTPGVLTDLFGISVMIPSIRNWYRVKLVNWFMKNFKVDVVMGSQARKSDDPNVVDSYVVDREEQ